MPQSKYANLMGMDAWGLPPMSGTPFETGVTDWLGPSQLQMSESLQSFDPTSFLQGGAAAFQPSWFESFMGYKDPTGFQTMGWGPAVFGMGKSLFDGWLGMEKLDLAKDSLNFQKDAFSKQFENQRTLTNAELRDRQAARVASNPTAYQTVDEYMKANGV